MGTKRKKKPTVIGGTCRVSQVTDEEASSKHHIKAAMLEVVENQLRDGDPPETRQTLKRLLDGGYSRKQAIEMIGSVVAKEIWWVMHEHQAFNRVRFVSGLEELE